MVESADTAAATQAPAEDNKTHDVEYAAAEGEGAAVSIINKERVSDESIYFSFAMRKRQT